MTILGFFTLTRKKTHGFPESKSVQENHIMLKAGLECSLLFLCPFY